MLDQSYSLKAREWEFVCLVVSYWSFTTCRRKITLSTFVYLLGASRMCYIPLWRLNELTVTSSKSFRCGRGVKFGETGQPLNLNRRPWTKQQYLKQTRVKPEKERTEPSERSNQEAEWKRRHSYPFTFCLPTSKAQRHLLIPPRAVGGAPLPRNNKQTARLKSNGKSNRSQWTRRPCLLNRCSRLTLFAHLSAAFLFYFYNWMEITWTWVYITTDDLSTQSTG